MNYFRFVLSVISIGSILYAGGTSKEQLFYDAVRLESTGDITNAFRNTKKPYLKLHRPIYMEIWQIYIT